MSITTVAPRRPQHELGSEAVTAGIRVTVRPQYLQNQSKPANKQYLFLYHVTIRNEGGFAAKLLRRHWTIVDAEGDRREVDGEGVVGHTPHLQPGEHFEYASYCPLPTQWGTMEGRYEFARDDGAVFSAEIGRFYFVSAP